MARSLRRAKDLGLRRSSPSPSRSTLSSLGASLVLIRLASASTVQLGQYLQAAGGVLHGQQQFKLDGSQRAAVLNNQVPLHPLVCTSAARASVQPTISSAPRHSDYREEWLLQRSHRPRHQFSSPPSCRISTPIHAVPTSIVAGASSFQATQSSTTSVALLMAQSYQQRPLGSRHSKPLPPHLRVAPFATSYTTYTHPTTLSYSSTTFSSPPPPPSMPQKSYKRKLQEALSAQSYSSASVEQTEWMPLTAGHAVSSPPPHLDALLCSGSPSTRPSSKFANVLLDLNEPPPEYAQDLEAPVYYEHGNLGARSSDGELFTWPWLQQHQGQIWSHPSQRSPHPLDTLINLGLDQASADGRRGRLHSGVRAWFGFMQDEMHSTPHRPMDPLSPLWAKLQEEWLFMRFASALIRDRHVTVGTVRNYCSAVQGWHAREHGVKLAAGLKLERLPQMLKGLRRVFGDPEVKLRRGFAPQALRRAMDLLLDPANPTHANYRAAISIAFQGLLRSAEFCNKDGLKFNPRMHLVRSDIKELTLELAIIMMTPCKNMKQLGGKTSPLVIGGGGTYIDAVSELRNLLIVDPTPPGKEGTTPLFRDPTTNDAIRYSNVLALLRNMMHAIGENADQFGTHSLRIGGATALFACGADETVIRTMGRWSSDIHRLYVRACFERCTDWTRRAGSARVTDVARIFDDGEDDGDDE